MILRDLALRYALRIRVRHSLPGRLRLHVDALKSVPPESQHLAALVARLLGVPRGIERVDVTFVTGNLLVQYDVGTITEQEILRYFRGVLALAQKHWENLLSLTEEQIPDTVDRLVRILSLALQNRVELESEIELPDDVWP